MLEWASYKWFLPETLLKFFWANSLYLYGLGIIPFLLIIRWLFVYKKGQKLNLTLSTSWKYRAWFHIFRFLIPSFFVFGLALGVLALARPQLPHKSTEDHSRGINLVLAIDVSESMANTDISPSRLEAAKQVAVRFLAERTHDRFGLVVFAGEASSVCPLTSDYSLLRKFVNEISGTMAIGSGTALGEAIAASINRLRDASGVTKAIILISDGDNTAGKIGPETAAELAKSFKIRVYSIGIGRAFDEQTNFDVLKRIALNSGGSFYAASSGQDLAHIFNKIDRLERNHFEQESPNEMEDFYTVYLNWSLCFLLGSLILKNTPIGNVLED